MDLDQDKIFYFAALVIAVILHEISHGVVAYWFGDDTAKRAGRLTLNPAPHVDPLGSIILPALGALSSVPVIAWAKPVPVNPAQLRNRRRDMLIVSLAGPTTNFVLMAVAAVLARALYDPFDITIVFRAAWAFALANLFLGVFNFLPIPPLDGASLIERVLPDRWLPGWYRFRPYGIVVLMLLVLLPGIHLLDRIITPFVDRLAQFVA